MIVEERLAVSNEALKMFARNVSLSGSRGRVYVDFPYKGSVVRRQWQASESGGTYPKWYRMFSHGGTVTYALSQLVRWCQDKPVLTLGTWRYWVGDSMRLARDRGDDLIGVLVSGGYPVSGKCMSCGVDSTTFGDWWFPSGGGPCCSFAPHGCKVNVSVGTSGTESESSTSVGSGNG